MYVTGDANTQCTISTNKIYQKNNKMIDIDLDFYTKSLQGI